MTLTAQDLELTKRFNEMPYEFFQSYINNNETGPRLQAWAEKTNYVHPSASEPAQNLGIGSPPTEVMSSSAGGAGDDFAYVSSRHPLAYAPSQASMRTHPYVGSSDWDGEKYPRPYVDTGFGTGGGHPSTDYINSPPTSVMAPNTPVESSASPNDFYGGDNVESITGDEGGLLSDSAPPAEGGTTAGQGHAWGMAGNTVGNMIDTRDKELVGGTQGSQSGYLKGALKGAGAGASIGTMIAPGAGTAWGGAIGAGVGLLGASQGYFDSRTPPQTTTQTIAPIRGSGFGGQSTSLFG